MPHLFEFMDQDWLPAGLRTTLREILDCGNSRPFRNYYAWAAGRLQRLLARGNFSRVVELGAGTAPITRHLVELLPTDDPTELVVCDLNPDLAAYDQLVAKHGARIAPIREPLDFRQPRAWEPGTLLCLSATLHHIPTAERAKVLAILADSAEGVVIFEPLRNTPSSMLFAFGSLVPSLVLPAVKLLQPGSLRRIFWCWLLPIAPLCFVWDGVVSCLREWSVSDWKRACGANVSVAETLFCQAIEVQTTETACRVPISASESVCLT